MAYSNTAAVRYSRRPWYWLAVLALVALGATILVIANARARFDQDQASFEQSRDLRGQRIEQRIDAYFASAIELANAGAHSLGAADRNLALVESLTLALLRSRQSQDIYGVGVFYAPYAFDGKNRLVGVYDHVGPGQSPHYDHVLPGGIDQVVAIQKGSPADDYTKYRWFKRAPQARNSTIVAGPYSEAGRSFISTLRAIYSNGQLVGVVAVDTLTTEFKALMASAVAPGDVAWIESSPMHPHEHLVGTAPIPPGPRVDRRTGGYASP